MATPICPKCSSGNFELKPAKISDSKFQLHFIQCSHCGCVVGCTEYYNIGNLIYKLAKQLHVDIDY
jgi:hypothetical protein